MTFCLSIIAPVSCKDIMKKNVEQGEIPQHQVHERNHQINMRQKGYVKRWCPIQKVFIMDRTGDNHGAIQAGSNGKEMLVTGNAFGCLA
ncbi:hypothetical protein H5410_056781 [Solanum commersonii]|uniref:Uncharacterized protein n=1 Tax=Solanum commersonii TaxID=4109 RepID=A0A9J5WN81_SOLCO|nr:hypothetical protein H5410_056781 [Solanum commersonii]